MPKLLESPNCKYIACDSLSVYKGFSPFVKCKIENKGVLKVCRTKTGSQAESGARWGSEMGKEQGWARSGAGRGGEPGREWSQVGTGARQGAELGKDRSQAETRPRQGPELGGETVGEMFIIIKQI